VGHTECKRSLAPGANTPVGYPFESKGFQGKGHNWISPGSPRQWSGPRKMEGPRPVEEEDSVEAIPGALTKRMAKGFQKRPAGTEGQ